MIGERVVSGSTEHGLLSLGRSPLAKVNIQPPSIKTQSVCMTRNEFAVHGLELRENKHARTDASDKAQVTGQKARVSTSRLRARY